MAAVNITLFCVLRKKKKATRQCNADSLYNFEKESCMLKIILIFFALSYLYRFLWDLYVNAALQDFPFASYICYDLSLYLDVLPFIGLLLFHNKNFKQRRQADDVSESNTERVHFG